MKKIFRTLAAVFAAGLVFAFSGCETDTEKVYVPVEKDSDEDDSTDADTTAPADVTNLSALASGSDIVLTWTDPADTDLYAVKIYTPTVARSVSL